MSNLMPTLFIGHGSPMNTIEENEFTKGWREIASKVPHPDAILCVSAHWYTSNSMIGAMKQPRTIHDFYGFPPELYQQQYPAPGAPNLAKTISKRLEDYSINLDQSWGLDHGTWSVLKQMYPDANIPTLQLSIDYTKPPRFHFKLGQQLDFLRNQGVLIIGSGNLVHNLAAVNWYNQNSQYYWAQEFEEKILDSLSSDNIAVFIDFENMKDIGKKAHPSLDHYLPLVYAKGAAKESGNIELFNRRIIMGSISMACLKFG
ncbi:MAG: 4,5-DOPA-extradiol-dioxygenase [Candidatus Thorarchaeota archaeon SMTZ1-45]